jgi:hypothetical protein
MKKKEEQAVAEAHAKADEKIREMQQALDLKLAEQEEVMIKQQKFMDLKVGHLEDKLTKEKEVMRLKLAGQEEEKEVMRLKLAGQEEEKEAMRLKLDELEEVMRLKIAEQEEVMRLKLENLRERENEVRLERDAAELTLKLTHQEDKQAMRLAYEAAEEALKLTHQEQVMRLEERERTQWREWKEREETVRAEERCKEESSRRAAVLKMEHLEACLKEERSRNSLSGGLPSHDGGGGADGTTTEGEGRGLSALDEALSPEGFAKMVNRKLFMPTGSEHVEGESREKGEEGREEAMRRALWRAQDQLGMYRDGYERAALELKNLEHVKEKADNLQSEVESLRGALASATLGEAQAKYETLDPRP